jgi:tRNA A-37 threonylcarbamoyl transferase component Bud32
MRRNLTAAWQSCHARVRLAPMEITPDNAVGYARQRGLVDQDEQPRIEPLSGGVACGVFRLHTARGPIVIKQAHEKFRVKEEWLVNPRRNILEAQFQKLAREALGADHVPEVLDVDKDNFAYTMASAALSAVNWKSMLLSGDVRAELGKQCAELLSKLHAMKPAEFLRDKTLFYQQRIEPYFEFTAKRHPDVAQEFAALSDTLMQSEDAVTHGDYTPKNFLVADGTLILLDYEVVHIGWPEFDIASIVNHLTLKALHLPAHRDALCDTAEQFLGTLSPRDGWLQCLGALMLARVDGKSPAEYLREEDEPRIREAAKQLLRGRFASYEEFHSSTF